MDRYERQKMLQKKRYHADSAYRESKKNYGKSYSKAMYDTLPDWRKAKRQRNKKHYIKNRLKINADRREKRHAQNIKK
jgi:hypothetical protein